MLCQRVKGLEHGDGLQHGSQAEGPHAIQVDWNERQIVDETHRLVEHDGVPARCTFKHSTIVPQMSPSNNAFLFALLLLLPSSSSLSSSSSSSWSWSSYVLGSSRMLLLVENRASPGHSEVLDRAARNIGVVDVCSQARLD